MRKTIVLATLLLSALPAVAQLKLPRTSQKQVVTQTVGLTDITIAYSRPAVKGRQIWGALVPYGKVWRTGANEATAITFSDDVTINGQKLPAGAYSLHTIPAADDWTIIFNKVDKQWGSYEYDQAKDALRVVVHPEKSEFHELLSYDFADVTTDAAKIVIRWEKVAVPFTVGTDSTNRSLANIRAALASAKADDWQTAMRAAQFANENHVASEDAAKWMDQSIKVNENTFNLWAKAQMQAKSGDVAAGRKTAAQAIAKATDKDKEEVAEIQRAMSTWK